MKAFNYRHRLQTLQKALEPTGHKLNFIMQSGQPTYILSERTTETTTGWRTCGFYYSATDAAEITNELTKQAGDLKMNKKYYQVGDMNNGVFSEKFASLEEAKKYLDECIEEGLKIELLGMQEAFGSECDTSHAKDNVKNFFFIVDDKGVEQ